MDQEILEYMRALRRSGKDVVVLDRQLASELNDELGSMMHYYRPNPQGPDYSCIFCHAEPKTNQGKITHKTNCLGERLNTALSALWDQI